MSFQVVSEPLRTIWMPVDYASGGAATVYVGQIVTHGALDSCGGVKAWVVAGESDKTADHTPFGIVIGTNKRTPAFNTTYKAEYITSTTSHASTADYALQEGMWSKGDPAEMVELALLDATTLIKGSIFNATYGVAPTEAVVTTGSSTGAGFTCATTGFNFTAVAYNAIYFCRTGANMGIYRIGYDTNAGTGAKTFYHYWPYDITAGDKFIGANIGLGTCKVMLDSVGTFIDCSAAVGTTNWTWIDVIRVDFSTAGKENAIFRINPYAFSPVRT